MAESLKHKDKTIASTLAHIDDVMKSFGLDDVTKTHPKYEVKIIDANGRTFFDVSAHRRELEDLCDLDNPNAWIGLQEEIANAFKKSGLPIAFSHTGTAGFRSHRQLGLSFEN